MRRPALWWGFVVVSMILVGCGGEEASRVYGPEELEPVLLTAADLGPAWTEELREVFTTRSEENPSLDPSMWCPGAADDVAAMEETVQAPGAMVELRTETAVRRFHSVREQAWSNDAVEDFFDTTRAALATCSGLTWSTPDAAVTMEPADAPTVGDESVAAVMTAVTESPEGDVAWRVRFVMARSGATLMLMEELEVQPVGSEPMLTDAGWSAIVDTAGGRIEQLTTG